MTGRSAPAGTEPIRAGRYARAEIDLDEVGQGPVELSLAAPFGALISALLHEQPFRVSRLALDYVAPDRLSSWATFSAKVSEVREEREATVSLLVYRGPRLFVRGEANVLMNAATVSETGRSSNGKGSEHMNGEPR